MAFNLKNIIINILDIYIYLLRQINSMDLFSFYIQLSGKRKDIFLEELIDD